MGNRGVRRTPTEDAERQERRLEPGDEKGWWGEVELGAEGGCEEKLGCAGESRL